MKVYRQDVYDNEFGTVVYWCGSKKECATVRAEARRRGQEPLDPHVVPFTPTRRGILALLNNDTPLYDNG